MEAFCIFWSDKIKPRKPTQQAAVNAIYLQYVIVKTNPYNQSFRQLNIIMNIQATCKSGTPRPFYYQVHNEA